MAPQYGPLSSLKGLELRVPVTMGVYKHSDLQAM